MDFMNSTVATYLTYIAGGFVGAFAWAVRVELGMAKLKLIQQALAAELEKEKVLITSIDTKLDNLSESLAEQRADIFYIKELLERGK